MNARRAQTLERITVEFNPETIRNLRLGKGLTLVGFSDQLGRDATPQAVSLWETGRGKPSIDHLLRIVNTFGARLSAFFTPKMDHPDLDNVVVAFNPDTLRSLREGLGLRPREFRARLGRGFRRRTLEAWEGGQDKPSMDQLLRIVNTFGAKVEGFFRAAL